jgi:transposase
MKKIVKQVVGIDVAKNELVICVGRMFDDWIPALYAGKTFANTPQGFAALKTWVNGRIDSTVPVLYVMEATGVYHESLAYYLDDNQLQVSIVLPNKISNYIKTLEIKTITDRTAAEAITKFGLERSLNLWSRPSSVFRELRQLTRERDQLMADRTLALNQLHAEEAQAYPSKASVARMKARIKLMEKQIDQIEAEIKDLLKNNAKVKEDVQLMTSITGIGLITAVTALAETNGFDLIRNKRQLASYAGFDVKEKLSGTSVKGKPRISKKGNRYLRKAMYMPSLAAVRCSGKHKDVYNRLVQRHGIRMKALVAIQRKLLEMMYIVHKTGKPFDKTYHLALSQPKQELTDSNSSVATITDV